MNKTNVQSVDHLLKTMSATLENLTPELAKAATYVLEQPNEVGICSIREIAEAAAVKPNTFVRLARTLDFVGYEDFRESFRAQIRNSSDNFSDRARWLQALDPDAKPEGLFQKMAASALGNVETTFAAVDPKTLQRAARKIINASTTYVLGVGINHAIAQNFAYLADMATGDIKAIPQQGSTAIDNLSRATRKDVLLAITFKPYRTEVVEAVRFAQERNMTIIGISDSAASPLITGNPLGFVVQTDSPQFFTSTVSVTALLETLMAFMISEAPKSTVAHIDKIHKQRHTLGIYYLESETGENRK